MTGAIAAFSAMAIAGRTVSAVHDTFEIMTVRSFIGIAIVVSIAAARGRLHQIRARRLGLHLTRNLFHFTGQNLWFWALTVIPLAPLFALEFTAPIWVMILAALFLGERLSARRIGLACLGFIGILVVTRPNFDSLNAGMAAGALAAICFAVTALFTKRLTRTEPILSILFWLTVMQAGFGTAMVLSDGVATLPTASTLPWLVLIGCTGLLAHYCLTTALSLAPAAVVMPVDFARLPVISLIGMAFYGEALDLWVFAGAALILIANYYIITEKPRIPATAA
ncbi:MAG: DMT family transporter [Paracoccaceae bacterium]